MQSRVPLGPGKFQVVVLVQFYPVATVCITEKSVVRKVS